MCVCDSQIALPLNWEVYIHYIYIIYTLYIYIWEVYIHYIIYQYNIYYIIQYILILKLLLYKLRL